MPEERIFVIPLRGVKDAPGRRRVPRAVKIVRDFIKRHMKSEEIKINEELNRKLWERGIEHSMPRVRVRAVKAEDGSVEAFLAEK